MSSCDNLPRILPPGGQGVYTIRGPFNASRKSQCKNGVMLKNTILFALLGLEHIKLHSQIKAPLDCQFIAINVFVQGKAHVNVAKGSIQTPRVFLLHTGKGRILFLGQIKLLQGV